MTVQTDTVAIASGSNMSRDLLIVAADQVSQWLQIGAPHTRPRSPEDLLEKADASLYALSNGYPIGHVSVTRLSDHASQADCMTTNADIPAYSVHYAVSSLVVEPDSQGRSVGSRLLSRACQQVVDRLSSEATSTCLDHQSDGRVAILSAIASDASLLLFGRHGFEPHPAMESCAPYRNIVFDRSLGKQVVSKSIQV